METINSTIIDPLKSLVSNTSSVIIPDSAVEQLRASLSSSSDVVTPDSVTYEQSIKRWSDAAQKRAAIVVYPASSNDVAAAVLFCQASSFDLAVCGGGHSTGGSSSTDGGLCIDLSKMRDVVVDPVKKTITAQGGALWADVDKAAGEHGLATVGGTVNHTGIGGLTLGGGYGWLSNAYGLAIDNLLGVEIVLADGSIVKASETENPDLFWAIRGAGSCFGVVTSFVYRAYDQKNPVWAGTMVFPPPALASIVDFANKQVEITSGKHAMAFGFGAPPPAFQPVVLVVILYNGPESEGRKFFEPLLALGPIVTMVETIPYSSVNSILNPLVAHGGRKSIKGGVFLFPMEPAFVQEIFDDFCAFLMKVPEAIATLIIFEYLTADKITRVAPTAMAFANRGQHCNLMVGPMWVNKENDAVCRQWANDITAKFRVELERKRSHGVDETTKISVGEYPNYDGWDLSAKGAFGVNAEKLVVLKKRYDAQNVFRKWVDLLAGTH